MWPFRRDRRKRKQAQRDATSLGRLLTDNNLVQPETLQKALRFQDEHPDVFLGQALIQMGVVDPGIVETMLLIQEKRRVGNGGLAEVIDFTIRRSAEVTNLQDQLCNRIASTRILLTKPR